MKANEEFASEVTHLYEEEEKWREEKQKLEQSLADTKVEPRHTPPRWWLWKLDPVGF